MILLLMSLINPADAAYMWGVGPSVNTIVWPSSYPNGGIASKVDDDMEETTGDIGIGAHGVLYFKKKQRIGSRVWYGTGSGGYRSMNWTVDADLWGTESNGMSALGGFGLGLGTQRWQDNDVGELTMSTYILKGQGSVTYRRRQQAYEIGAYAGFVLPGTVDFQPIDEDKYRIDGASSAGLYPQIGIQATVFFGDFKPPTSGKKKKGKKRR
jgi:opacity protein-like surface antigen